MKNTIKLLMCAVMALCFASCTQEPETDNTQQNKSFTFALSTEENYLLVSWDDVDSAVYYEIQLNDEDVIKTDKTVHRFTDLEYETTYTVSLSAINAAGEAIESAQKSITTKARVVYAYREWGHAVPASAISDNAEWVVGCYDMSGMIINLKTNNIITTESFAGYDIDNNGVAVGSYHASNVSGVAAMYVNGEIIEIDLSNITENNQMSCLTSITPDGSKAVGWYWNFDSASAYWAQIYGDVIPFYYDVINDTVSVPTPMQNPIYRYGAMSLSSIAPDGSILGVDQQTIPINVIWESVYNPYEYILVEVDPNTKEPLQGMGDLQNRFSPSGRYVYGASQDYTIGNECIPSVYDRETKSLYRFNSMGKVAAMSDDGTVFVYNSPYGNDGSTFVTTTDKTEAVDFVLLETWLLNEHNIDVAKYDPLVDMYPGTEEHPDPYAMDGTNVIGTSADGRTLLCITQTAAEWVTSVIYLDGASIE